MALKGDLRGIGNLHKRQWKDITRGKGVLEWH